LLSHTWGYPGLRCFESANPSIAYCDELANKFAMRPNPDSDDGFAQMASTVPLVCQPGQGFRFGIGPFVAAHIACRMTGKSLEALVSERLIQPLGLADTGWVVPEAQLARVCAPVLAVPKYVGSWGLAWTGPDKGHTSWLGWKVVPMADFPGAPTQVPEGPSSLSQLWSTAADVMKFQCMLAAGGVGADGTRVLSVEAAAAMTSDLLEGNLASPTFNTHAKDKPLSAGQHPAFGVGAPGQGVGGAGGMIADPSTSRVAGCAGSTSSIGFPEMVECWNDPASELTVFYGAPVSPFHALPELRQEIAAIVYGANVPACAAAHFRGGVAEAPQSGGMMGNAMNMMMMMSMFAPMGSRM